jgi:nicotinamidase-related amidase
MRKNALLIIDMQVGAAQMQNPAFYQMDELVKRLYKIINKAREKAIPVYYAQHHNPNGFPAFGSDEWKLIPELEPQKGDTVIHKTTPDVFLNTTLHELLQENGIEQLVIGGIQTADCIDTTCRRAYSLGYEVILLEDGHTTFDTAFLKAEQIIAHHNQIIGNWFGRLVKSEDMEF